MYQKQKYVSYFFSFVPSAGGGFTLIELLVVVLIIGILSAVALPQYNVAVGKARYVELMTLGRELQLAQERYFLANGSYSKDLTALDLDLPPGGTLSGANADITYPNGNSFRLRDPYVYAISPSRIKTEYTGWYEHSAYPGLRQCLAYAGNETAEKICRALGGTVSGVGTCAGDAGGSCKKFDLP